MVNRLWRHHFGAGLVRTLDNFGRAGARPSHPELLDWLACELVRQGWSLKALHRLMVTSATYRQSSRVNPMLEKLDPGNTLWSRMPLERMSADQLYDSLLLAAGQLDQRCGGPPDHVKVRRDGLVSPSDSSCGWRRSIYLQQQRKVVVSQLEAFDFPQMNPNCLQRRDSTSVSQALHLMNNGMVYRLAQAFAHRVRREAGDDPARQVAQVHLIAFGRPPVAQEQSLGVKALSDFAAGWSRQRRQGKEETAEPAQEALVTYCHAILNAAAFLYID
jgi:hypothetical protein